MWVFYRERAARQTSFHYQPTMYIHVAENRSGIMFTITTNSGLFNNNKTKNDDNGYIQDHCSIPSSDSLIFIVNNSFSESCHFVVFDIKKNPLETKYKTNNGIRIKIIRMIANEFPEM